MKLRMPNYKQDFKNINENLDNISTEIKELKNLMIKSWRAEDMEENSGKFRWPFDEHGNLLDNVNFSEVDVVFFALPHNVSQNIIKDNFEKSIFIDLSADFRLDDPKIYKNNYNTKHQCPSLLNKFVYGLPEINFNAIQSSKNVAVPGCYPTSILLPLIPLLKEDLILSNNIIIDSKSGYSGAGSKFNLQNLIQEKGLNFYNYNTNNHRHICEIYQELTRFSEHEVKFSFNPHILPIFRGMMSTIYCDLKIGFNKNDIINIYNNFFSKTVGKCDYINEVF